MSGMIATLNKTPLSAQPCGVPDSIGNVGEVLSFIRMRQVAWLYSDLIIEIVLSWKPRCLKVSYICDLDTLSKAALKSDCMIVAIFPSERVDEFSMTSLMLLVIS